MATSDVWFAPMGDVVTRANTEPPLGVVDDHFVAIFDNDSPQTVDRLREAVPEATLYVSLPFATFPGDRRRAESVAGLDGVGAVVYATRGYHESETLVNGFDVLMSVERLQRNAPAGTPDVIGGATVGDVVTRPALMPVVNFSIGPLSTKYPSRPDDPVNLATLALSANQLVVTAAGNDGARPTETMSAWAEPDWVLAVGATADREGTTLADTSSRGVAESPASGPDLVAFGASSLDESVTGTSFAAPRVARLGLLLSAVLLQLRRPWLASLGEPPQGTELVGSGFIDSGYSALRREFVEQPGLPALGLVPTASADCFGLLHSEGSGIVVHGDPRIVRRLIIAAARPVPGYLPHQVGAGFIDEHVMIEWLHQRTALEMVEWFGSDPSGLSDTARRTLAALKPFDATGLQELLNVIDLTSPMWAYDYRDRRLGRIP